MRHGTRGGERSIGRFVLTRRVAVTQEGELWLGTGGGGATVAVKRVRARGPLRRRRLARAMRRLRLQRPTALLAVIDARVAARSVWIVREWDGGVPLGRLSAAATLAAGPATALAHNLLRALASLHERGIVHGRLTPDNVFVEPDGSVRLSDAGIAAGRSGHERSRRQDVTAAAAVIRDVWSVGVGAPGPPLAQLLASGALDRAPTAGAALRFVVACEAAAAGGGGHEELAAVARRLLGDAEPVEPVADAPAPAPARRRSHRGPAAVLAAAAALAATAATLGVVRPWTPAGRVRTVLPMPTRAVVLATPRPAPPPPPTPTPVPTPAPTPAPAGSFVLRPPAPPSAGLIVDAEWTAQNGPCPPATPCDMTTWLDLGAHDATAIDWQLVAVDECTGAQSVLYSVSVTAAAGQSRVSDSRSVTLPGSDPLKLYTLSIAPVRVASEGLVVTPGDAACPG